MFHRNYFFQQHLKVKHCLVKAIQFQSQKVTIQHLPLTFWLHVVYNNAIKNNGKCDNNIINKMIYNYSRSIGSICGSILIGNTK